MTYEDLEADRTRLLGLTPWPELKREAGSGW